MILCNVICYCVTLVGRLVEEEPLLADQMVPESFPAGGPLEPLNPWDAGRAEGIEFGPKFHRLQYGTLTKGKHSSRFS